MCLLNALSWLKIENIFELCYRKFWRIIDQKTSYDVAQKYKCANVGAYCSANNDNFHFDSSSSFRSFEESVKIAILSVDCSFHSAYE